MTYEKHFPLELDYSENIYLRVKKENKEKFNELKAFLISKSKREQFISESEINQFLNLMIDIEDEEFKYYLTETDRHVSDMEEYFSKVDDYVFREANGFDDYYFETKKRKFIKDTPWAIRREEDCGFWQMAFNVLYELLRADKRRGTPMKRQECMEIVIIELLKYRSESMRPEIKEKYTGYKIGAIAAYVAHKVFGLMSPKLEFPNKRYHQYSRKAITSAKLKHPELFVDLKDK